MDDEEDGDASSIGYYVFGKYLKKQKISIIRNLTVFLQNSKLKIEIIYVY